MSGSTENAAYDASERPEGAMKMFDLETAKRMLPLARRIVADLLRNNQRIAELGPEVDRLDRHRRDLSWPERARRYHLREEITACQGSVHEAMAELDGLGIVVLDAELGRMGFPTIVNDNRAFFSWRPGEEALNYWHFAGETVRRVIPPSWFKIGDKAITSKR